MDAFLLVYGIMHVMNKSRKEKEKQLRKWVLEDIISTDLKDKMRDLQKKHRQAIEEKDCQLALFNNDLQGDSVQ